MDADLSLDALRGVMADAKARATAEPGNREAQFAQECQADAEWSLDAGSKAEALDRAQRTFAIMGSRSGSMQRTRKSRPLPSRSAIASAKFASGRQPRRAAEYEAALDVAQRAHSPTAERIVSEQRAKLAAIGR